jgi:hypothetical protein
MKRNPTPEYRGIRTKVARADSLSHPRIALQPGRSGVTTFSDTNAASIAKREIWRAVLAIKEAGSRDVLIISTPEYVQFVVTIKLPKAR